MLKNRLIVKRIRNIVILLMAIIIMIGAYKNIGDSKAEGTLEIYAVAFDNYGLIDKEEFKLEAVQVDKDLYEVELPKSVNSKEINQIVNIKLEDINPEIISENAVKENAKIEDEVINDTTTEEIQTEKTTEETASTENETAIPPVNTQVEDSTENSTEETPLVEETTQGQPEENVTGDVSTIEVPTTENQEQTEEAPTEEQPAETITEETQSEENVTTENTDTNVLEVIDNKIQLTKEQMETKQLSIEVIYNVVMVEKDEEGKFIKTTLQEKTEEEIEKIKIAQENEKAEETTKPQMLYRKILTYEDEENLKMVEVKGLLPIDAELQVEEVSQEQITEIFGEKSIDVAYDIKIIRKIVTLVPEDENNPESELVENIEIIEIDPKEFEETCEVSIKDLNIQTNSQVYHVKEDNTYEETTVIQNTEDSISFEAETFSIYAVGTDEGIMTAATANLTVGNEADDSAGVGGIYWGTNSGIGYPSVYVTGSVSSNHNMLIELSTTKTDGVDGMTPGIFAYADSTKVAYTPDVTGLTLEGAYYLRYKVWAKDTSGNTLTEYGVSNSPAIIDDVAPTAGTMTFKKKNSSGTTVYPGTSNPKYNTNIYMTINSNGSDGYGVKSTKYTVTRDGTTVYSDRTSYVTVSTAGAYVVTVTTTDYGGNTATRTYKFTIDKTAPVWNTNVYSQSVSGSTLTLSLRGSDAVALNTSRSTLEGKISSITVDGTAISTSSSATPYYAIGTSQTSTKYEIMHIYIYGLSDGMHNIVISIAAGALVDSAGNTSIAKTYTISAGVDTKGVAPTWNASVSSATLSGTNGTIIVEGTDDVGLASSSTIFDSILVVNGTNNYLTSSNTTKINDGKYLISFSVPTEGAVTVELQIYQGALRDYAGNGSAAKTYTLSFYVDTIKPTWNASVTSSTVNEDICTIVVTGKDEKMLDMDVSTLSGKLDSITVDGTTIGTTVSTTTPYYELSTETASGNTDEAYTIIIHGLTTGTHSIGVNIGEGALVDKADTTAGVIYDSNRNTSDAKSYTVSAEVDITPPEWNASVDSSNISGDMCTIKITGTDETALNSSLSAISDKLTVRLEYTAPNSTTHVTTTIGTTVSTTTPYYELGTATTTTNSDGEVITKTFPITIRGLETGSYNVTIVVAEDALVDGFGNTSLGKTYSLQIDIDRSQPIWEENATIETHSTNESVALITITGTDETALNLDLSGITSTSDFTITVDGSAFTDLVDSYTLVSSSSTSMVYRFFIRGLSNGTHTIKISLNTGILVDLEGNVSGAKDYEFTHTINLVAPVWNTNITEKTVNGSSATIKVTGTDEWYINTNSCHFGYNNSNVTVKVNNTSTTEFTTGGWSQDTTKQVSGTIIINNLPDGENTISVTIAAGALADGAGNGSAAKTYTFTVIVDTTPPVWSEELWNIEYDESAEILNFTLKINDATSIDDSASTVSGNILVFQLNENGTTEAVWANTSDGLSVSSAGLSNNGKTKSWNVTINGFSGQRVKVILQSGHQTDTYGNTVSTQKEYDVVIKGVIPEWAPQSELTGSYNSSTNQWTVELTGKDSVGLDNSLSGLSQSDVTVKITRNNEDGTTTTTTTDFTLGAESNTTTTITIPITINGVTSASDIITITIAKNTLTDTQGNKSQAMEYNFTAGGSYLISASSETSASSLFLSGNVPDRTDIPQRQNIESVTFLTSASSANSTKWDVSEDKTGSIVAWYTGSGPYQVYIAPTEGTKVRANPNSSYLFAHVGYSSSCTKASVIIGLDNLITTSVTNMNSMFRNCGYSKMTSLNLGTMSTTNVTRMISMFQGCGYTAMTNLDLGTGFDTSHVSMMTQMFYECGYGSLVEFTMGSNFNTSNVNSMDRMFYNFGHETLTSLNLGSNFNTSNVLWMMYMFYGCGYTSMTTLNLGTNFNTSSVTNFDYMFQYCGFTKLTSLDLGDVFYTDSSDTMRYMFNNCGGTAMTVLDLGPAFTNVDVSTNEGNFMTEAGKSGNFTIYAPSSIFSSTTAFRQNSAPTSTITRTSGRGTINPIYRPKWSQTSVTVDSTNKALTVALKGAAYESSRGYASTVTSTLTTSNVTSKVDGTVADLTKTLGTKTTATENGKTVVKYTSFKLSNFPRTTTANGYWEYSGNVGLVFAEGTLVDEYGNPNLATDQNGEVILKTTATTKNTSDYMFADFVKPRVVTYSSSMSGSTQVILFDVYDKYLDTSDVVTADELTVLVDGVEQTGVTKTITNVADLTASVSDGTTTSTKTIGKRYTVNVTGFQNASTLIGSVVDADGDGTDDYVDGNGNASGTVSIQVKAGATKDLSENTNDLTTINGVFVDKTKPVVIYRYSDTDIDTTNATVTIKFDITDKYYSSESLGSEDLVIKVDGETIWNGAAVSGADVTVNVSDTLRELTDGTDIGRTCTITLSGLDDDNDKSYLDYSGVITVAIAGGVVTDTSGNTNDATTLTVGINLPEQSGTGKVVDVVKPEIFFHDGNGTSTEINNQVTVDPINNKVVVKFKATDKYFSSSSLQASDITAKIGSQTMTVDSLTSTDLSEKGGHNLSIGKEYTLTLSGGENTGAVTITIPADKILDTTGNKNTAKTITTRVIDLTNPTITVSPDKTTNASANDYVKSQSVTITAADNSSGLKSDNEYKYCLLASGTTPTGSTSWTTYTNGGSTTLGTGLTGTYYLYVKSVYDNEGNKSTTGDYHTFGPYKFDNKAPNIATLTMKLKDSTGYNYINDTWVNESVYISPNGGDEHSGVGTITYKVDGGSAVSSAQTLNPGVGAEKEYKVIVTVTDKLGNSTTSGEYTIKIDKKAPIVTITADKTSRTNATSITYTFDWSEEVWDFTADGIEVTNGSKGTLDTVTAGRKYTMVVTYETDNVEVTQTVNVKAGAVSDKANRDYGVATYPDLQKNYNVATSKSIVIDHIDPEWKYSSKDIYYTTANDVGNDNYANAGRTAKIVFKGTDANGHNVTSTLAKSDITVKVNSTPISDSKKTLTVTGSGTSEVTCTLIIDLDETSSENGALTVVIPAGTLKDDVTDTTKNTNVEKSLTSDISITVDNVSPGLELKVTSPNNGNTYYRADQVITITAKYTEQIYKEITSNTLIDTTGEAPAMKLSFESTATERTATCTTVSADKLTYTYTYTIQAGDNGALKVKSLAAVYDAAGNAQSANNTTPQGYSIIADTIAPIITITPPSENVWRKEQTATVTITDDRAGLATGGTVQYGWSTSTSTEPSSYTTVTLSNNRGDLSTSFEATTNGLLGEVENKYYLWVKPSVKDIAMNNGVEGNTNTTTQKSSGTYYYDKKTPTISLSAPQNTTWSKTHSVTVELADGGSGLDAGGNQNIKYGWAKLNDDGTITDPTSYTPVTLTNAEKAPSTTFTATNNTLTGKYYLWVVPESANFVKDISNEKRADTSKAGNKNKTTVKSSGTFYFDNKGPKVEVPAISNATTYTKTKSITINITDANVGTLLSTNSYQYYLSTSATSLVGGTWTNYTPNTANTIGSGYTGIYYMFIKSVSDSLGNTSVSNTTDNTTVTTIESTKYHRYGTYYFDNKGPKIEVSPTSNNTYTKTKSITINITDANVGTLLSTNSYQYYLSTSETSLVGGTWTNYTPNAANTIGSEYTGIYYMFIKSVSDSLGNTSVSNTTDNTTVTTIESTKYHRYGTYYFDNKGPKIEVTPTSSTTYTKTKSITIKVTDANVGTLLSTNEYEYYLSTSGTSLVGGTWTEYTNNTAKTIGSGLTGRYYLFVKSVSDSLGNTSISNEAENKDTANNKDIIEISSIKYHRYGEYYFDNKGPKIEVSPTSNNTYTKTKSITINITDANVGTLLATNSYQYYLSTSATSLVGGTWTNYTPNAANTIGSGYTGIYYMFIKSVSDSLGNTSISNEAENKDAANNKEIIDISSTKYHRYGTYYFDNTRPYWSTQNINIDKTNKRVTVDLIGTDAHSGYASNSLDTGDITIKVDGEPAASIDVSQTGTGMEIKKSLSSASSVTGGVKYTLTLTNWEQISKQTGKGFFEWSGTTVITVAADTLVDNATNTNQSQDFTLGHVDFIQPKIEITGKTPTTNTQTITFSVFDKYMVVENEANGPIATHTTQAANVESDTTDEIVVYVDGDLATGITKQLTTINKHTATINGATRTVGYDYQLVISGFDKGERTTDPNKNFVDYSGTVSIKIKANAIADTESNKNNVANYTGDFIDCIKPDIKYQYIVGDASTEGDINHTNETFTMVFDITDKYININSANSLHKDYEAATTDAEKIAVLQNYVTIKVGDTVILSNTVNNTDITKILSTSNITSGVAFNKTVSGSITPQASGTVVGKRYTLVLSNLDLDKHREDNSGNGLDYSGIITVALNTGILTDTTSNTNIGKTLTSGSNYQNGTEADTDKIVDVVDPVWSATVKSIDAVNQKVTVTLTATDKYLDTTNTTLVASDITSIEVDRQTATGVTVTNVTAGTTTTTTKSFDITLEGWEQGKVNDIYEWSGTTEITIRAGTARDLPVDGRYNTSNQAKLSIGHIDVIKPKIDQDPNPPIIVDQKQTIIFYVLDKYLNTSDEITENELEIEIGDAEGNNRVSGTDLDVEFTLTGPTNVTGGHQYTIVIDGFGNTSTLSGSVVDVDGDGKDDYLDGNGNASGTVFVEVKQGAATDMGLKGDGANRNINDAKTLEGSFMDNTPPAVIYRYSQADINRDTATVTVKFDVTDKFYASSSFGQEDLVVKIDGDILWNGTSAPTGVDVAISITDRKLTNGTQIGKTCTITITDFNQGKATGKSYIDYSGVITVAIAADVIKDNRNAGNAATSLTMGYKLPESETNTGNNVEVDLIKPIWEASGYTIDKTNKQATVTLTGTDKFLNECTLPSGTALTDSQISVKVDGETASSITRKLSNPTYYDAAGNTVTGVTITNMRAKNVVKIVYTLTLSGWEQGSKQTGKDFFEWSGTPEITVAAGTLKDLSNIGDSDGDGDIDTYSYSNDAYTFTGTLTDFVQPKVEDFSTTKNTTNKKETITFKVKDKYIESSELSSGATATEIVNYLGITIDNDTIPNSIIESLTVTDVTAGTAFNKTVSGSVTSVPATTVIGYQYTLVLSNFDQGARTTGKNFIDYSGTVEVDIDAGLAKDSSDNTNNASNGNVGDFIDFINPDIKYQYVAGEPYEEDDTDAEKAAKEGDTNHTNETFTMVFDITDKYINTNNLTQSTLSNYLTIKVDGEDITTNADVTKTLTVADLTSTTAFNKTVSGTITSQVAGTVVGKQYTLVLSNLDLDKYREDNSGNGIDYSGVITLALKTGILTDTSSNTNANTTLTSGVSLVNGSTSGSNKVVDVVDPVWSVGTPTINYSTQTVTVTLTATDKYLDTTNTTLAANGSDITVYVDGEVASSITKSVAVGTSTATTKTFTLTLTGWEQGTKQTTPTAKDFFEWSGTTIIKIAAETARDQAVEGRYNLSNDAYLSLGHIDVIKPKVEDFTSSVDQTDKKQTISFTIKDKYINASQLTTVAKADMTDTIRTQIVNYLGLTIDNETLPNGVIESITVTDKTATTAFSKTVNEIGAKKVYNTTGDVDIDGTTDIQTVAIGTRIGYTYTLVLSNFEQVSRNGKNFVDYSGTVYMNIGANLATDKSRTETPTGGALGNNASNNNKASFVDFVKPDIKYLNSQAVIDHDQGDKTFTMTFDITDKYFNTNNLTQSTIANYLTIKVDGVDITTNANVTKTLTVRDVESTVAFNKTVSGSVTTASIGTKIGTEYTLTLSNLEQLENGYSTGDDYSGVVTVVLKEGIIQDETVDGSSTKNTNPQTTITSGKTYKDETETGSDKVVDVVDPVWSAVVKNIDYANQKVTVTLTAYDKYLDTTTTTLTAANITLITVDGRTATGVTVTGVTSGSSTTTTKSFDITLEGWENGKNGNFYEWSGTTAITVAGGTAKDLPVDVNGDGTSDGYNESEEQIISIGHIDVIKPKVEKVSSVVSGETQTIVFNVIDQFLDTTDDVTESEITVYVDGQEASSVTKQITNTTTVAGGKQYTLTLTNWEQTTKQTTPTAKDFIEWSGTVAIEIAAGAAKDTSSNTLDNPARTTTGGILDTSKVNNLLRENGTVETKTGKILIVGEFIDVVKPKVEKISSVVSGATQTIVFRVMDKYLYPENINDYEIQIGDITIKVDGEDVTSVIGKSLGTPTAINKTVNKTIGGNVVESQSQVVGYEYTVVLSNFDKVSRTTDPNKNFVDYSGTVTLEIAQNALKDTSGNILDLDARDTLNNIIDISAVRNVSDTTKVILIGEFIDCVQPDIKYEYSASDINHTNETFTMVFDITDKYIDTTTNKLTQSTIADYLTIKVDGEDITTNADVTKTLTDVDVTSAVAFNKTVSGNINTVPIGTTIGKQYTLVLSNLDLDKFREDNSGDGFKYSGVITVAINDVKEATGEKIIADTSANTIVDTALTSGSNYINKTDANTDKVVDVVDPVWKVHNISGELITVRIVDKYLKDLDSYPAYDPDTDTGALKPSDIQVIVNGHESTHIIKNITGPTKITDTEYEWNIELDNITPESPVDTTFIPENADELVAGPNGFQYKTDNSGYSMIITIQPGVIEDQYANFSNEKTFTLTDNLDVVAPGIYEVQKIQNPSANTETIIFNVTDRNYDDSDLVALNEIKLWIDEIQLDAMRNGATLTYKEIIAKIDNEEARTVGHQYTLVVNNIGETAKQTTPTEKDYLEYSGTLKIEIVAEAAKDLNNNKNESKIFTDFVDYLKPRVEPIGTSIDATNKKYTMTFKVTDKYLDTTDMVTTDEITVYIDGEEASSIVKSISSSEITATMNKTVSGTVTNGTYIIGHTYTLELSGFEQGTKQSGKDFYEWSGLVAIEINKNAAKDTTNTTGDTLEVPAKDRAGNNVDTSKVSAVMSDLDNRIILVGDYVDFIKPKVEDFSSSVNVSAKTETITFKIKDKYIESSELSSGATASQIATYLGITIDNEAIPNSMIESLTVTNVTAGTAFNKTLDKNGDGDLLDPEDKVESVAATTVIGYQYTLVLSNFEQSARNDKDFKNYSGTVTIDVKDELGVDEAGNTNDDISYNADFVDFIKPDLKYTFATADIDKTNDTYKMVFDITDKYYTSGQLALANITSINIYNGKENIELKDELELDTEIRLSAEPKYATSINYTETDGTVTVGKSQVQIGHTYTLTILNLDNAFIESGDTTANYSGVVTIAIAGDVISDRTANSNTNKNVATSLTSGISVANGSTSGSEVVVDTVNPIWEKVSTTAYAVGQTATITVKGTDTYFIESSTDAKSLLSADEIEVYVNGTKNTSITPTVTLKQTLTEQRIVGGVTDSSVQYGVQYEIGLSGFAVDANQVKIKILANAIIDQSGNGNKETEFIAYNVLKKLLSDEEDAQNSTFYGGGLNSIQRQNIENITFTTNGISDAKTAGYITVANDGTITEINNTANCWDISAQRDRSILAWIADGDTAPYKVYIGSNWEIFANQYSRSVFSYIGYASNCTAPTTGTNAGEIINNLDLLNTDSVTYMAYMFQYFGYSSMTKLDLGTFETKNVTDMHSMFQYCGYTAMEEFDIGSKFDTSNVKIIYQMFTNFGYNALETLSLGTNFNTISVDASNAYGMTAMFLNAGRLSLKTLDLGTKFNTSNVTNMASMFFGCGYKKLENLDLSSGTTATNTTQFNTGNVTNMNKMFYECGTGYQQSGVNYGISELNLGNNFNTSKVTSMESMFYYCGQYNLEELDLKTKFDTKQVTDMQKMFYRTGQYKMTKLNLGGEFDTSLVTNMYRMFYNCGVSKLTSLDLGNKFDTNAVTNMEEMFNNCGTTSMTVLDLGPEFTKIPSTNTDMFTGCGNSYLVIYAPEAIYEDLNSFKLQKIPTT